VLALGLMVELVWHLISTISSFKIGCCVDPIRFSAFC